MSRKNKKKFRRIKRTFHKRHSKRQSKRQTKRHSKRQSKKTRRKSKQRVRMYGGYDYTTNINSSEDVNLYLIPSTKRNNLYGHEVRGNIITISNHTLLGKDTLGKDTLEQKPLKFRLEQIEYNEEEGYIKLKGYNKEEYDIRLGFTVKIEYEQYDIDQKLRYYRYCNESNLREIGYKEPEKILRPRNFKQYQEGLGSIDCGQEIHKFNDFKPFYVSNPVVLIFAHGYLKIPLENHSVPNNKYLVNSIRSGQIAAHSVDRFNGNLELESKYIRDILLSSLYKEDDDINLFKSDADGNVTRNILYSPKCSQYEGVAPSCQKLVPPGSNYNDIILSFNDHNGGFLESWPHQTGIVIIGDVENYNIDNFKIREGYVPESDVKAYIYTPMDTDLELTLNNVLKKINNLSATVYVISCKESNVDSKTLSLARMMSTPSLSYDKEYMKRQIDKDPEIFRQADDRLKNNKEDALELLNINAKIYRYLSSDLQKDAGIICAALKNNYRVIVQINKDVLAKDTMRDKIKECYFQSENLKLGGVGGWGSKWNKTVNKDKYIELLEARRNNRRSFLEFISLPPNPKRYSPTALQDIQKKIVEIKKSLNLAN